MDGTSTVPIDERERQFFPSGAPADGLLVASDELVDGWGVLWRFLRCRCGR